MAHQVKDPVLSLYHTGSIPGPGVDKKKKNKKKTKKTLGIPVWLSGLKTQHSVHEDAGSIPASLSGLRVQSCHDLWHKLHRQLRSGIAVAVA